MRHAVACAVVGDSMPQHPTSRLFTALDRLAPNSINSDTLHTTAFSDRVDIRAQETTDDVNGSGVRAYLWYRNSVYLGSTPTVQFRDVGVTAGQGNSYSVAAIDFHGNIAPATTFNVQVPPVATALDAREVGVRPTGSYWGGGGEQIDMRSGNLNFSLPLLKLVKRGWSVPLAMTYNSQNQYLISTGTGTTATISETALAGNFSRVAHALLRR